MASATAFIGLRVPEPLKREWEAQAKKERRSLSNWILHKLESEEFHREPSQEQPRRTA